MLIQSLLVGNKVKSMTWVKIADESTPKSLRIREQTRATSLSSFLREGRSSRLCITLTYAAPPIKPTQTIIGPLIKSVSANKYYVFKKKYTKLIVYKNVRIQIRCLGILIIDKELLLKKTPIW
tara:strand:+ start:64 stop:432 length:369 start_codon:yes stop_codon:yes gene_type:complete